MGISSRGLLSFVARLHQPPLADSDAELLDRFVRSADEDAFTGLVRRHGPMVLSVCQRRLGREDDAEDAFQAVFLALATSARSIGHSSSLAGWLYRVAYLISLKAAGRRARLPATASLTAEVPMAETSPTPWETKELKTVIDRELAGLPDKFRSVVVLCLIEGHTNVEAASVLGVPVGTIDSRLSTARRKLQNRLTRRGVSLSLAVTLEQMLGGPLGAGDRTAFQELVSVTVRAVLAEAAGPGTGAVSPTVASLARGAGTMISSKLRLAMILGVTLGALGGAGAGIYYASAADPAKPVAQQTPVEKLVPPDAPPQTTPKGSATNPVAKPDTTAAVVLALQKPFGLKDVVSLGMNELLARIEDDMDLVIRVDIPAFRRRKCLHYYDGDDERKGTETEAFLKRIYGAVVVLPRRADKLSVHEVLTDSLAQVRLGDGYIHCTFQVRGSQVIIIPGYVPPTRPGVDPLAALDPNNDQDVPVVTNDTLNDQIYGGEVNITADRKPLLDILADLRKQTGANIVFDPRCEIPEKKATLSMNISDVRLYDALRVIADMAELKMVYAGNIYYVTTPENAKSFQPVPIPQPPARSRK